METDIERLQRLIEEHQATFPPVKEGYTRIFTDHTGRWYEDIKISTLEKFRDQTPEGILFDILQEEIQKEHLKELQENSAFN